ncbi:MAG TPA: UDP-N-acetylglucosamine 2-epimerase (non-hydrolyzing), partial [Bacteroidales bacterium]|nr:UDP-N-acetylglucosamine 2-epimerase (non-hydrolyzing) [Bacteroidales bacterium]
ILLRENPDLVIVYGDTNTTLAGALAASKLHIPVAHIEAGLRSYNKQMPEEQNRIIADNLATWLFCPTDKAVENLKVENITKGVHQVGDIMLDATIFYRKKIQNYQSKFVSNQTSFVLATLHREENTENEIRLGQIMEALNALPVDIILPLHPRTRKKIEALNFLPAKHIQLTEPLGYFEMLALEQKASCIITDSGGVQKEAYFMQKPCITLRNETEWTETVDTGWNILAGASKDKIMNAFTNILIPVYHPDLYGNGTTAEQILTVLAEKL